MNTFYPRGTVSDVFLGQGFGTFIVGQEWVTVSEAIEGTGIDNWRIATSAYFSIALGEQMASVFFYRYASNGDTIVDPSSAFYCVSDRGLLVHNLSQLQDLRVALPPNVDLPEQFMVFQLFTGSV